MLSVIEQAGAVTHLCMALIENMVKSTVNGPGSSSQLPPWAEIWGVAEYFQAQSPHLQDNNTYLIRLMGGLCELIYIKQVY